MSTNWLTALFDWLFAAIRAKSAANAGGEVVAGRGQVEAAEANSKRVKEELAGYPKPVPVPNPTPIK